MSEVAHLDAEPSAVLWSEQSVLAACMERSGLFSELAIHPQVFTGQRRHIANSIRALVQADKPVDPVSVANHAETTGQNVMVEVAQVMQEGVVAQAPEHYESLRGVYVKRVTRRLGRQMAEGELTATELQSKLDALHRFEEGQHAGTAQHIQDTMPALIQMLDGEDDPAIPTKLHSLDSEIGGFMPGDLVILGARPGVGKTSLGINMAVNCGQPTVFFSGEQPARQITARIFSQVGSIDAKHLRSKKTMTEEDWAKFNAALPRVRALPIHIDGTPAPTVEHIVAETRRCVRELGTRLVVVDYLQRLKLPGRDRVEELEAAARELKKLAVELDICVIALSQVNRDAKDRLPKAYDLKGSGGLEQEADQVVLIHRPEAHDADNKGALLIVDKNRHGPPVVVNVAFVSKYTQFVSKPRTEGVGYE